ncbi:MAG: hypothetical protein M1828_006144 [Chrysothrix sp. TS-e1954]|nr:MAG: hypothetical protein M1828_006144 [Chrysothrix sp. TS-e1954]
MDSSTPIPYTYHLIQLHPSTTRSNFLSLLQELLPSQKRPLIAGTPCRWIAKPDHLTIGPLLSTPWDLLLLLPTSATAATFADPQSPIHGVVISRLEISTSMSKEDADGFAEMNHALLSPSKQDVPLLPAEWRSGEAPSHAIVSDQEAAEARKEIGALPVDRELTDWAAGFSARIAPAHDHGGAVSMLDFLAFNEGAEGKAKYSKYGEGLGKISGKRGARPKHFGDVTAFGRPAERTVAGRPAVEEVGRVDSHPPKGESGEGEHWDQVGVVHFPSVWHLVELLASEEYKDLDRKLKKGALKDLGILCVTELAL